MAEPATDSPEWDPLSLTYAFDGEEVELPMRLLLLGRFSTAPIDERRRESMPVARDNVDALVRELRPTLDITVSDRLLRNDDSRDVHIRIEGMDDFGPENLVRHVPVLAGVLDLIERLRGGESDVEDGSDQARLLAELGFGEADDQSLWRDYAIAELNDRLGRQLDEILHHPEFQELEANWRSLCLVMAEMDDERQCRIDLLDVGRGELLEDFRAAANADASLLFQTIYAREFGQYGGEPYAAVIAGYQFGPGADDVELLRHIARVCSYAHAPFLAGAAPAMFGLERFDQLVDATSLPELKRAPRFAKWWGFVDEEITRYVALTVPRVLLRRPYDSDREGTTSFAYRENVTHDRAHGLWGSAAFAFAGCLLRSYERFRVCVDITGPSGGRVQGLPEVGGDDHRGTGHPVEVLLSERKEAELSELGFMPLAVARAHDYVVFNAAHSLHWAAIDADRKRRDDPESLGLRLGAQLPYIFLISRVAHYLKVIQRDMVGTMRTEAEMEAELHGWLRRYVSDVENPAPALRARRPLRKAELSITDDEGDGSSYRMHLNLVPHTKFMSAEFSLSLDGRLGKE